MRIDHRLKAVTFLACALLLSARIASAQAPVPNAALEQQLEDALRAGQAVAGLEVTVASNVQQLNRAEYRVPVIVRIAPGSDLAASGGDGSQIEIVGIVTDPAGFVSVNFRDRVVLDAEQARASATMPIAYSGAFTMLPGRYTVRVAVMNQATGRVGTAEASFVIRNLARNAPQR
jgi:hypothetical protein